MLSCPLIVMGFLIVIISNGIHFFYFWLFYEYSLTSPTHHLVQYLKRLLNYAIPKEKIGVYFGERKEIKEITISTYQSVIYNPELIRKSNMVIFDEVHLVSDTAKVLSKIFDIAVEDPNRA